MVKRKKPYWYAGTVEQFEQTKKKLAKSKKEDEKWSKEHFKKKSNADLRRIVRTKKGNTDDEGAELGRRLKISRKTKRSFTGINRLEDTWGI